MNDISTNNPADTDLAGSLATQSMTDQTALDRLSEVCADVLKRCVGAGASQAEVAASIDLGLDVGVRMGEVETITRNRDRGVSVSVYFGHRKGSAHTADLDRRSIEQTVEHACAIARYTEEDSCNGLADPTLFAHEFPDLDVWHPWDITADEAVALALEIESAGRSHDKRISNSDGASVQVGATLIANANSLGFAGTERSTRHSLSCALIAGSEAGMQRDYWYDTVRSAVDFMPAAALGRRAAERALARLDARTLSTRQCTVLFVPEVARGLLSHLVSAVSGGALYRRATFLLDHLDKKIFPDFIQIDEHPRLSRGLASSNFDGEGVATRDSALIRDGVLTRYVLGSYSARKLGMTTTGNAGGVHNLIVKSGTDDFAAMLRRMGTGLVVTELMGQGVSLITGDYSRGAAGFWVENGEIAYPVEEVTIASNLRDMFANIVAVGSDIDKRSHVLTGSILIERMTVAGE